MVTPRYIQDEFSVRLDNVKNNAADEDELDSGGYAALTTPFVLRGQVKRLETPEMTLQSLRDEFLVGSRLPPKMAVFLNTDRYTGDYGLLFGKWIEIYVSSNLVSGPLDNLPRRRRYSGYVDTFPAVTEERLGAPPELRFGIWMYEFLEPFAPVTQGDVTYGVGSIMDIDIAIPKLSIGGVDYWEGKRRNLGWEEVPAGT